MPSNAALHQAVICSTLATKLPCVSIAPLATPVVPPVYCKKAKSSCVKVTGVMARFWLSASTCLNEMALSIFHAGIIFLTYFKTKSTMRPLKPRKSPILLTMMCCMSGRCGKACSKVTAKLSKIKIALAPESLS